MSNKSDQNNSISFDSISGQLSVEKSESKDKTYNNEKNAKFHITPIEINDDFNIIFNFKTASSTQMYKVIHKAPWPSANIIQSKKKRV